jgi:hypothetical protein
MLKLRKVREATRGGMYAGQFTAVREGDYRIEVEVPDSPEAESLLRTVRVRVPDLEIERPERNDMLLGEVAKKTGGFFYIGMDAAMGRSDPPGLANMLVAHDQETYLPGTPNKEFERRLMSWLLAFICGAVCLEWLIRRLNKLA